MLTLVDANRRITYTPLQTEELQDFLQGVTRPVLLLLETDDDYDEIRLNISMENVSHLASLDKILKDEVNLAALTAFLQSEGLDAINEFTTAYVGEYADIQDFIDETLEYAGGISLNRAYFTDRLLSDGGPYMAVQGSHGRTYIFERGNRSGSMESIYPRFGM